MSLNIRFWEYFFFSGITVFRSEDWLNLKFLNLKSMIIFVSYFLNFLKRETLQIVVELTQLFRPLKEFDLF